MYCQQRKFHEVKNIINVLQNELPFLKSKKLSILELKTYYVILKYFQNQNHRDPQISLEAFKLIKREENFKQDLIKFKICLSLLWQYEKNL